MEWKANFGMEYGIIKVWNGMERILPYFHTFSILAHFNVVFILSAVNKAAFD